MIKESVTFLNVTTYSAGGTAGAQAPGDDSFCAFFEMNVNLYSLLIGKRIADAC